MVIRKELRDHQKLALRKLSNGKILWGGVGTGKTLVAATYYIERESPKHVYVITTAKKRDDGDWQDQFYELGIGPRSGPVHAQARPGKGNRARGGRPEEPAAGQEAAETIGVGVQLDGGSDECGSNDSRECAIGKNNDGQGSCAVGGVETGSGPARVTDLLLDGDRQGQDVAGGDHRLGQADVYPYVLTVDSWNNISKYADVHGAFFIFDEQRLVGSGNWTRKFLRIAKNNHWILLTATPGDTWMDYVPVFIANGFYKNRTDFKREHVVYNTFTKFPKVDRYINVGRLAKYRHQLLVEMTYERHTKRKIVEVRLEYDKDLLDQVIKNRWNVYEERPLRDIAEMFTVGRRVVNSHPSRLEMICNLWTQHPKLIVFYNFNFELASLRSLAEYYGCTATPTGYWSSTRSTGPELDSTTPMLPTSSSGTSTGTPSANFPMPSGTSRLTSGSAGTSTTTSLRTATSTTGVDWNGARAWTDGSPPHFEKPSSTTTSWPGGSTADTSSGLIGTSTSSSMAIAEWNGHKHQAVPSSADRWLYLVQYTAGAEAWDCVETDAMAFYSRNYSWKVWEQAKGRIDRLNTPFKDLWYYDFMTYSMIDTAIGRSLKAKKDFNESDYKALMR